MSNNKTFDTPNQIGFFQERLDMQRPKLSPSLGETVAIQVHHSRARNLTQAIFWTTITWLELGFH
jgi:hypothetical protein